MVFSVSISGDYAVVGAYLDDDDGDRSGSAYIFVHDGENWSQQTKLTADDADILDSFGMSVSISGRFAIIGAHENDDDGDRSGSAYIYHLLKDETEADITITPNTIDFGEVEFHRSAELTLTVSNIGNADLTVSDISATGDCFSVNFTDEFILEPDDSQVIDVTFTPNETGELSGLVTITSDDPDEEEVTVDLVGVSVC